MRISILIAVVAFLATSTDAKHKCHKKKPAASYVPLAIPADQYVIPPAHPGSTDYQLKAGANGEYMGGSRGYKQAPPKAMNSVPVVRTTYEPRTNVKAAYSADYAASENVFGRPALMVANAEFGTKVPTINLANFVQIRAVACTADRITAEFDSADSAGKAAAAWGATKDLAMLIPREIKCNGKDEVAARTVTAVARGSSPSQLVFTAAAAAHNDVIDTFDVKVNQYDLPTANGNGTTTLTKRSFFKWDKSAAKTFDLGVNFDASTRRARKDPIPLLKTPWAAADCVNCFVGGEATLSLRVTGTMLIVKTYEVALQGDIQGNLDILLTAFQTARTDLINVNLFVLPLNPFSIPGIMTAGPELRIKAGLSYDLAQDLTFTTGFHLDFPFSWSVKSDKGLFAKPVSSATGGPKLTPHAPELSKDFQIGIAAHLIPEFAVAITILNIPAFDLALNLDNAVGLQLSRGEFSQCPNGGLNLMVFHQHDLNFIVHSVAFNKNFQLFTTGRLPLPCPGNACNRCIGQKKSTTSLIASSTSASTTSSTATTTSASTSTATSTSTSSTPTSTATTTATSSTSTSTAKSTATDLAPASTTTSSSTTSSSTSTTTSTATSYSSSSSSPTASTTTTTKPTSTTLTTTTSSTTLPTATETSGAYKKKATASSSTSTTSTSTAAPTETSVYAKKTKSN
ncbi:hypothetical protein BC828DRAFT_407421 [Blastocladiella britannica]|nr:hypothetical protein BC828DRAFT_407421 [Blastocladiella britannica]